MLKVKSAINQANYSSLSFLGDQQQQPVHLPDHLKCGEVFTWLCADELYGVECKLCEDHPLCPLSEFPQHMDIWHTEWAEETEDNEGNNMEVHFTDDDEEDGIYKNDRALVFTSKDCGSFKPDHELHSDKLISQQDQHEEILEPFEQVLIEQDISINTIQINEDTNDEEYFKDANVQVAEANQCQIENKQKQKQKKSFNRNATLKHIINKQKAASNEITESERDLPYLTEIKENATEPKLNATKDLRNKHKSFKYQIKTKNYGKFFKKCRNYKRKLGNINENIQATSGNETNNTKNYKSREKFNKSGKMRKTIEENLTKIKQIKKILSEILRDMNLLKESDQTESETIENEINKRDYQNITKYSSNKTNTLRNNWRLGKTFETEKETSEREQETSEREKETSEKGREASEKEKEANEIEKETNKRKIETRERNKKTKEAQNDLTESGKQKTSERDKETSEMEYETKAANKNNKAICEKIESSFQIRKNNLNQNRKSERRSRKITASKTLSMKKAEVDKINKTVITDNETNEPEMCKTKSTKIKTTAIEINPTNLNCDEAKHSQIEVKLIKNKKERSGNETKQTENEMVLFRNKTELSQNKIKRIAKENELNELEPELYEKEPKEQDISEQNNNKTGTTEYFTSLHKTKSALKCNEKQSKNKKERHGIEPRQRQNETEPHRNEKGLCKNKIKQISNENELEAETIENGKETEEANKSKHNKNKTGTTEYSTTLPKNKSMPISKETEANESELCIQEKGNGEIETSNNEYLKYQDFLKETLEIQKKHEHFLKNTKKSSKKVKEKETITKLFADAKETSENETQNIDFYECLRKSKEIRRKAEKYMKRSNRKNAKENKKAVTKESGKLLNESRTKVSVDVQQTSATETTTETVWECIQKSRELRNQAEYLLREFERKLNENEKRKKANKKQYESETEKMAHVKNYLKNDKLSIVKEPLDNDAANLRKTRKSLRISRKNLEYSENSKQVNETDLELRGTNENEKPHSHNEEEEVTNSFKDESEEKEKENKREFNESELDDLQNQRNYQTLSNGLKRKHLPDLNKRNEFKRKLRNYTSEREDLAQQSAKRLRTEPSWKRRTIQKALKRNKFSSETRFSNTKRSRRKSIGEVKEENNITDNFFANSSNNEFCANSDFQECEISLPIAKSSGVKRLDEEEQKGDPLTDSNVQAKEKVNEAVSQTEQISLCSLNLSQKEESGVNTKQTLVTQFFANIKDQQQGTSKSLNSSEKLEHIASSEQLSLQVACSNQDSCTTPTTESSSPFSPKTEEEHFEFYEPKEKLNKQHISHLIKLYREHPRLWDQSHTEFCEPQVCRKSWQRITDEWNEFCKRKFTIAEIRIRICTLCQRFMQERDRLALEGEVDECAKFPYYEQMQFLEQQKSLQKRRELYDQQNEKILEIYQHFPILWHISGYKLKKAKERAQAIESISKTLKLFDLHLSPMAVRKRLRSLRKCYRLEKIRHLHAQVEQTPFEFMFRHYERMNFLDKHIDPFVCRICGKIFENLQNFRLHLETESHGSVLAEESEAEQDLDNSAVEDSVSATNNVDFNITDESCLANIQENELKETETETFTFSAISPHPMRECFSEPENSRDILQRFTPFPSSTPPIPIIDSQLLQNSENPSSNIKQVLNFPLNTPNEPIINSLHLEDQLIEEIMENVTNNDSLSQQGLDQFINTVTSCDGSSQDFTLTAKNCLIEKTLSPNLFHSENSFVVEHPDIVTDQTSSILSLSPIVESFTPLALYTESSCVIEHPDVETDQSVFVQNPETDAETFVPDLLETENSPLVEYSDKTTDTIFREDIEQTLVKDLSPYPSVQEELDHQIIEQEATENLSSPAPLVVKVQCPGFSLDLQLNPEPAETLNRNLNDSDNELFSSADISTIPLPDHLIHKMIEIYRKFPQLWNPNHLDYNSRTLRRQAWCLLTAEFNSAVEKQISWRTLHRKLTDYAKYYKKLIMEQEDYELLANKWTFYEDFKFLDDVIVVNNELQRSVHHRDNNFKIIATYKTLPQLWDTKHPDYNKRGNKQRNIEIMCNRLQEENNLQLTTERLKNRLIELRTQYRTAKKQRLKCLKNKQKFSPDEFEYYEGLNFLDDHIDPFTCDKCKMEFKKRTDYKQHLKREHAQKNDLRNRPTILPHEPGVENICHICGIKFTTRSNLMHHVRRHEGIRDYACTMCPKKFYASHALKVHIRSHTKECPYTCEKCGMSFVSASKLNQHVKRHLNKKDFQCDFCTKAFFTGFEKDRHERRHLNIRDKACPICGKTFVAGSSYYTHLMLHDDTKRFECDKCNMKFAQYAGLYKHKKRHHM